MGGGWGSGCPEAGPSVPPSRGGAWRVQWGSGEGEWRGHSARLLHSWHLLWGAGLRFKVVCEQNLRSVNGPDVDCGRPETVDFSRRNPLYREKPVMSQTSQARTRVVIGKRFDEIVAWSVVGRGKSSGGAGRGSGAAIPPACCTPGTCFGNDLLVIGRRLIRPVLNLIRVGNTRLLVHFHSRGPPRAPLLPSWHLVWGAGFRFKV